jgi:hypothetical protein
MWAQSKVEQALQEEMGCACWWGLIGTGSKHYGECKDNFLPVLYLQLQFLIMPLSLEHFPTGFGTKEHNVTKLNQVEVWWFSELQGWYIV